MNRNRPGRHNRLWASLLAVGVAACVWQLSGPQQTPHDAHRESHEADRPRRLFDWEPLQAASVTLEGNGRLRRFERGAGGPWHEAGHAASEAAPTFDPVGFVDLFSQARVDRWLVEADTAGERGAAFQLEPPRLHIRIVDAQGAVLADVTVGARSPDGFGRYLRSTIGAARSAVLVVPAYQTTAPLKAVGMEG